MQSLRSATDFRTSPDRCAQHLLTVVPLMMRFIRHHVRRNRQPGLSVPQFRTLIFLSMHPEESLSAIAEHVGLSLPAASRMVDLLVRRRLMKRQSRSDDRRRVSLSLTPRGRSAFETANRAAQVALAHQFAALPREDLVRIREAMDVLNRVFEPEDLLKDGAS